MSQPFTNRHGTVTLHFHSKVPGFIADRWGAFTPNASHIYIASDTIAGFWLAHEFGHIQQAKRLGWRYLPWIAWTYLAGGPYASTAEKDATAWAWRHFNDFPSEVRADD